MDKNIMDEKYINYPTGNFILCQHSNKLLNKLIILNNKESLVNKLNIPEIEKAIFYAKKYHGSQMRQSGEPYYSHPLEVAYMISDYLLKTDVIIASILHDIIEDTEATLEIIADNFGFRITQMVDRLTRDRPEGSKLSVEEVLNNAYKNNDREVILIKLMDRLHNMQTIDAKSPKKIKETIAETLNHFIILSEYLLAPFIARQIQTLCIRKLEELEFREDPYNNFKFNFAFSNDYQPLSLIYQNAERLSYMDQY